MKNPIYLDMDGVQADSNSWAKWYSENWQTDKQL